VQGLRRDQSQLQREQAIDMLMFEVPGCESKWRPAKREDDWSSQDVNKE